METAKDIIARAGKLKNNWSVRNKKIREWYDILTLKDELAQEGMESVVSNDPRTGYNLGKHLMTSSIIAHKIAIENLSTIEVAATSYLETYQTARWLAEENRYRKMGRQSFIGEVVGYMLSTGWYSVFSMVTPDESWSESWNPYEVFPEFGPDGTVEVAHVYPLSAAAANRKAKLKGWKIKSPFTHNTHCYDYWGYDDGGSVVNGVVLGTELVKPLEVDLGLTKLGRLPVFMSPVGGLPDQGSIYRKWQEHFGESIVATNANLATNYNRMLTFAQQMVRDTATPRWFEQSSGDTPILREPDMFKRGAIFRGAPGETVGPLPVPPIPVELRTALFDYQNMLQRGLFPWVIFGNIQQQMSYLAMANVASSALQVLTPYMEGFRGLLADIDNFQIQMMLQNGFRPHGFKKPDNLPERFEFEVEANIEIPGYAVQKATVARMLDPSFRLSTATVMDKLFPEIKDSLKEIGRARRDEALFHPKAILVDQIIAYREQARVLREGDPPDEDSAKLYEKLATSLEAELDVPTTTRPRPQAGGLPAVSREVSPKEAMIPPEEILGGGLGA